MAANCASLQLSMVLSDGIVEVTECRVRSHAADRGIRAMQAQFACVALRTALAEVAAIHHAAGDRETPASRLDGEFIGREYIPDDERPTDIGIAAIAAIVRQAEFARGEVARGGDILEPRAQHRCGLRTGNHLRDGLPLRQQLHLPVGCLHQVAASQDEAGGMARTTVGRIGSEPQSRLRPRVNLLPVGEVRDEASSGQVAPPCGRLHEQILSPPPLGCILGLSPLPYLCHIAKNLPLSAARVRDELLGLPVRERDWVVVGARPEDLTDRATDRVGKDFPVFLHPQTQGGIRARAHRAQDRPGLSRL